MDFFTIEITQRKRMGLGFANTIWTFYAKTSNVFQAMKAAEKKAQKTGLDTSKSFHTNGGKAYPTTY